MFAMSTAREWEVRVTCSFTLWSGATSADKCETEIRSVSPYAVEISVVIHFTLFFSCYNFISYYHFHYLQRDLFYFIIILPFLSQ